MSSNLKRKRGKEAGPRKVSTASSISPKSISSLQTQTVEDELSGPELEIHVVEDGPTDKVEDDEEDGMDTDGDEESGEGEWGGLDDNEEAAGDGYQHGTKPRKPPTGEELRVIKDATDLFRSSSFKLQVHSFLIFVYTEVYNVVID